MSAILDLLGGGLAGGLFGVLGSLGTALLKARSDKINNAFKMEQMKAKHGYNLQMIKAESDVTIAEVNANIKRDQIVMDGKADAEEAKGRNSAIMELSKNFIETSLIERMMFNTSKYTAWLTVPISVLLTFLHGAIDLLRTSVRPVITYASTIFSFYVLYIAFGMYQELGVVITAEQLYEIIMTMIKLITFLTTTAYGFWFMDKSMSRQFQKSQ